MLNQIARFVAALVFSALAVPAMAQIQERTVRTGSVVETHRLDATEGTYTWSVCNTAVFPNGTSQTEQAYCMSQTRKITAEEAATMAEMHTEEMLMAVNGGRYAANTEYASRQNSQSYAAKATASVSDSVTKGISNALTRGYSSSESSMASTGGSQVTRTSVRKN